MEEDNVVLSYDGEEDLPEITIRKKTKINKNSAPGAIATMLYEEGKRVSWIYLTSLILYFSAVALEVYVFLSYDQEKINKLYSFDNIQEISYKVYIMRNIFAIKSLYIGLIILLAIAAGASVILWYRGKREHDVKNKISLTKTKERRVLYGIRLVISFLGYLSFIGGYFLSLYVINSLSIKGMENNNIMQYNILFMGEYAVFPIIYANRYVIVGGVLTAISLIFLATIAKIHKGYKIMAVSIIAFPLLGVLGFFLYKNAILYYPEKRLILIGVFLVFFCGAVFLTHKVSNKVSKKGDGMI